MEFRYGNNEESHLGGNLISTSDDVNKNGDPATYITPIWDDLVSRYNIKSVFDVGCGAGYSLKYFKDKHSCTVIGLEGLYSNVADVISYNIPCIYHDINNGPVKLAGIDLVNTLEVAEHIEEKYVNNYINTLIGCRVVCMTAARPGQGGHHHVNCRPQEYWVDLLESRDMTYQKDLSEYYRTLHDGHFKNTGMIFTNNKLQ